MTSPGLSSGSIESVLELCRVCESPHISVDMLLDKDQHLAVKYSSITGVQLTLNDGIPSTLCKDCVKNLDTYYEFKTRCEQADAKWRNMVLTSKAVKVEPELVEVKEEYIFDFLDEDLQKITEHEEDMNNIEIATEEADQQKQNQPKRSKYNCDTCDSAFNDRDEYNQHIKVHGLYRYQCTNCLKWLKHKYLLKLHLAERCAKRTNPAKFYCDLCSQWYSNQANLNRHKLEIHEGEKRFECKTCGKRFSQNAVLKAHSLIHIQRKFVCSECPKEYKSEKSFIEHKQTHLPPEQRDPNIKRRTQVKICICTYCGKQSNSQAAHDGHVRTHTNETPYSCTFCPKKFKVYPSLKSHLLIHYNQKPFKCNTCGACFRQASHLKTHSLCHTKERKHVCLICSKTFALRGNLNTHLKTHKAQHAVNILPVSDISEVPV